MPRVKRSINAKKKRRKVLKAAKGYRGGNGNLYRIAAEAVERGLSFAYRDRRNRKRVMRRLWITRINAAARLNGISYSRLMNGLAASGVGLDRKVLADMAARDPEAFARIVETARSAVSS